MSKADRAQFISHWSREMRNLRQKLSSRLQEKHYIDSKWTEELNWLIKMVEEKKIPQAHGNFLIHVVSLVNGGSVVQSELTQV